MAYTPVDTVLWLDLPVLDLDRALSFYEAMLQVKARDSRPNNDMASIQFSPKGSGLTLIKTDDLISGSATPYLNCNGRLEDAIAKARLNGGTVLQDKHAMEPFGYRAVLLDSEGNRIALHSAE